LCFRSTGNADKEEAVKRLIRRKYEELGPISFHELSVLLVFVLSILLWFFRNPQFMPGWGELFTTTYIVYSFNQVAEVNYKSLFGIFILGKLEMPLQ